MSASPPLALTLGDPSGIGPEITIAAWSRRFASSIPPFYVLGDPRLIRERARQLGNALVLEECAPRDASAIFTRALPVVPLVERFVNRPGESDTGNAAGIVEAIDRAAADTMSGAAAAIVTNPIAKKSLYDAGFKFPGHTEYLAHLAARATGRPVRPVMMLAGPRLRAVPVTVHVPLADVPRLLTAELLLETIRITAHELKSRFGIDRPRLAIAGLNPHAGEAGSIGGEDEAVIRPAVDQLRREGIDATGPLPADTMFHTEARARYDVAICMYHDQALIPAKTLGFDDTVNVTLGLPFVRTSPDHGTAFDIAGKGVARPDSLIAALELAATLAGRQSRAAAA